MQITDLVPAPSLTSFIREVPSPTQWILNRFLPDELVDSIEASIDKATRRNRAAQFRTFDAESPIGARNPFERSTVTLPPLSEKIPLGEQERLALEAARNGGSANSQRLIDQAFNDAENLAGSIKARMELARGDVLSDGKFTLAENGLALEADFGLPAEHLLAPANLWSDTANSTPIADLEAWCAAYEDANGERPGYILMSRKAKSYITASAEARSMAAFYGAGVGQGPLGNNQLQALLEDRDLPQIQIYSATIDVAGTKTRPIEADRVVLLPQNPRDLGYTAWGITAEALEFNGNNAGVLGFEKLPGLFACVMKQWDPVRTWTKVAATGMPLIENPDLLMVADVY